MTNDKASWISCGIEAKCIKNNHSLCWSGIVLCNDHKFYILTSVAPLAHCLVVCANLQNLSQSLECIVSNTRCTVSVNICPSHAKQSKTQTFPAKPLLVWNCHEFETEFETLNSSPQICNDKKLTETNLLSVSRNLDPKDLQSWFILFELTTTEVLLNLNETFNGLKSINFCDVLPGMAVWTNSFPFGDSGHSVFKGCISKGIICNVVNETIILIDACCLPGSEGCVVYSSDFSLVGIVVSLLGLKTEQLSGLSIVCSLKALIKSLKRHSFTDLRFASNLKYLIQKVTSLHLHNGSLSNSNNVDISEIEVVALSHSKGWGSGVVVAFHLQSNLGKVFIATCRHVVQPANGKALLVRFSRKLGIPIMYGKVVYSTTLLSWLDFALVEVSCSHDQSVRLLSSMNKFMQVSRKNPNIHFIRYAVDYKKGTSVFTKGHCLFDNITYKPSLTKGIVSNVLYLNGMETHSFPILLHSNCVVLDGTSGGSLFSTKQSLFYGLVVNNIKQLIDDQKHILYPRINFILPALLFMPSVVSHVYGANNAFGILNKLSYLQQNDTWILPNQKETSLVVCKNILTASKL